MLLKTTNEWTNSYSCPILDASASEMVSSKLKCRREYNESKNDSKIEMNHSFAQFPFVSDVNVCHTRHCSVMT